MGETSKMNMNGYNFLLVGSQLNTRIAQLDLDQDGKNDVELVSGLKLAGPEEEYSEVTIKTLHDNCEINIEVREDSIFQMYHFFWQYAPDGTKAYFHTNRTSCYRESIEYQPSGVEMNNYLVPLSEGDFLEGSDYFESGKFQITTSQKKTTTIESFPDSTVYYFEENYLDCFSFPQGSSRFIGFKMKNGSKEKLGWIEVVYLGGNELRVRDWVIQE